MLVEIVTFFARRTRLTIGLWLALLGFGVLAYTSLLPREGFPAVDIPIAVATGAYFVDDAERVDAEVLGPMTDAVSGTPGVRSLSSFARPSSFVLLAELTGDLSSPEGVDLLVERLATAELPADLFLDVQAVDGARFLNEFDLLVGVAGPPDTTAAALDAAAAVLLEPLAAVDGVARVELQTLEEAGVDGTGQPVVRQTSFNRLGRAGDGPIEFRPSVSIGVRGVNGTDQLTLSDRVDEALATAAAELPPGFTATIAADFAGQIRSQLGSLQSNALAGVLAVFVTTLVLISWRASVIAAGFVVTVLATVMGILHLIGISLNTVSLFGVILSLGLFVDDAVVVAEAIDAFKRQGAGAIDTIRGAVRRVGTATVAGTLTTILVFTPLLFISGILGEFIRQLPITVIVGLSTSIVLSLVLIPTAARLLVLRGDHAPSLLARIERAVGDGVSALPALLGSHRRTRGRIVAVAGVALSVAAVIGGGVFAGRVGFDIFPPARDSDLLVAQIEFDPGASLDEAEALAAEVDRRVARELGDLLVGAFLFGGTERSATTQYELVPFRSRDVAAPELAAQLEPVLADLDGARVFVDQVAQGPPREQFPFQVQVYGEDVDAIGALAAAVAADLDGSVLETAGRRPATVVETTVALTDQVARADGRRFVEVRARFDVDDVTSTTAAARRVVEQRFDDARLADEFGLPAGTLAFDLGIESDNAESFASTVTAFFVALGLMFGLLVVQFRSLVQPLLVFLAIPFTFFGVFGGLYVTGNPVSFLVTLGLIGLIGIAVNNTILLTDFANQERRAGADRVTAISTAVKLRFRALVTTSLTTVAGLLPLALSDPFWEPLAFTIIFGLLSSTALVLLSFPYYYLAVEWLRDTVRAQVRLGGRTRTAS